MCGECQADVNRVWAGLAVGDTFRTPDDSGADFRLTGLGLQALVIDTQDMRLSRDAFDRTIHYLRTHRHTASSPCEIRSNSDPALAGPLCLAARGVNSSGKYNPRCINYILPILAAHGLVRIDGASHPNTTWLS